MAENLHIQAAAPSHHRASKRQQQPADAAPADGPDAPLPPLPHDAFEAMGLSRAPDGSYLVADTFVFRQQVRAAVRRPGAKDELLGAVQEAWSDPAELRAALQPTRSRLSAVGGSATAACSFDGGFKDSFARLLLQCDDLQTGLASMLLERLAELQDELEDATAATGGGGGLSTSQMPLPKLILSQFRWLEHVADGAALLAKLGEMLEVCDAPLKRELILALPDLVQDGEHGAAVELLSGLLREESQLTATVLETLSSLQLDEDAEADVCDLVVQAVASAAAEDLPAIVRFLLAHVSSHNVDVVAAALRGGLSREMLDGHGAEGNGARAAADGHAAGEALLLEAFLASLRLRAPLAPLLLGHLEGLKRPSEHRAVDWWLLVAVGAAADARSKARASKLLADKAAKLSLTPALLRAAIAGHAPALRPHLPLQISLAAGLLRSTGPATAAALGASLYATLFDEFAEPYERQDILGELLTHAGSGVAAEVDAALGVLVELATRDARAVSQFSPFLTGVLDYLDALTVPQARLAFELFARISYDADGGSSRLADELQITIRKQLTSAAPRFKTLGVLGGCCLLGRLGAAVTADGGAGAGRHAAETEATEGDGMETIVPLSQASSAGGGGGGGGGAAALGEKAKEEADALLSLMLRYASAPDGSFGFLLHELSLIASARDGATGRPCLHGELVDLIKERITASFEDEYLHDIAALPPAADAPLVRGVAPTLALGLDDGGDEEAEIAVNVLPLLHADGLPGGRRHALCTLSATFQLLRVCEAASSEDAALDGVDAVLGCPLYLFSHGLLDDVGRHAPRTREALCLALFYTVDWLRELVNAFCTQRDFAMRKKVLQRLRQLQWLERSLDACLGATPSFRLPAALADPSHGAGKKAAAKAEARAAEKSLQAAALAKAKAKALAAAAAPRRARARRRRRHRSGGR